MSVLNEVKEALNTLFGAGYYFGEAPEGAPYPYRIGTFGSSSDDDPAEVMSFELDYWDQGKSTAALLDLIDADAGDGHKFNPTGLNRRRIAVNSGYAVFTKETSVPVEDPDKSLRHRHVTYTMRLYREG